jgi:hypothetical protein
MQLYTLSAPKHQQMAIVWKKQAHSKDIPDAA